MGVEKGGLEFTGPAHMEVSQLREGENAKSKNVLEVRAFPQEEWCTWRRDAFLQMADNNGFWKIELVTSNEPSFTNTVL